MALKACLPPHADTGVPGYTPPPKACDAHMHVFGPVDRFPLSPTRAYDPPPTGALSEDFVRLQATLGFERAVLVQPSNYGTDNSALVEALAGARGRWLGVTVVDESSDAAALRRLHEGGIRGARFNFVSHLGAGPDLDNVRRILDAIAPLGWNGQFHIEGTGMSDFAKFFEQSPVTVVVDHMGRTGAANGMDYEPFQTLVEFVKNGKCWVKVSGVDRITAKGSPYADAVPFAQVLVQANPDRCVWGTDWPHTNMKDMPRDELLVDLIPEIAPSKELRQKLLVDNPATLYGF
ncbi:MAG: amidohydrolase family protein [Acetobacterales bacterium]